MDKNQIEVEKKISMDSDKKGKIEEICGKLHEKYIAKEDISVIKQELSNTIIEYEKLLIEDESLSNEKKSDVHFQLGFGYLKLEQDVKSLNHFENAIKIIKIEGKKIFKYHYQKHFIHYFAKDYEKALNELDICSEIRPKCKECFFAKGLCYSETKEPQKAIIQFREVLEIDKNYTTAMLQIGLQMLQYDPVQALQEFRYCLLHEKLKDTYTPMFYEGVCHMEIGDFKEAVNSFKVLLEKFKDDPATIINLIQIFEDKIPDKAKTHFHVKQLYKLYSDKKILKKLYHRSTFSVGKYHIKGFEFFELTKTFVGFGQMQGKLKYLFLITHGDKNEYRISLGSYDMSNSIFSELNPGKPRTYHLDGYYPRKHKTFGFYPGCPNWDVIKDRVKQIVSNEVQELSSTVV